MCGSTLLLVLQECGSQHPVLLISFMMIDQCAAVADTHVQPGHQSEGDRPLKGPLVSASGQYNSLVNVVMNWGPWSDMICSGNPSSSHTLLWRRWVGV